MGDIVFFPQDKLKVNMQTQRVFKNTMRYYQDNYSREEKIEKTINNILSKQDTLKRMEWEEVFWHMSRKKLKQILLVLILKLEKYWKLVHGEGFLKSLNQQRIELMIEEILRNYYRYLNDYDEVLPRIPF